MATRARPGVDVVDWVERIPFYETRNYVQRVMENLAVYRQRISDGATATANALPTDDRFNTEVLRLVRVGTRRDAAVP